MPSSGGHGLLIPDDPDFFLNKTGGGGGPAYIPPPPIFPPGGGGGGFASLFRQSMPGMLPSMPPFGGSKRLFMSIPAGAMRTAFTSGSSMPPENFHASGMDLGRLLQQLMGGGQRATPPSLGPMTYNRQGGI